MWLKHLNPNILLVAAVISALSFLILFVHTYSPINLDNLQIFLILIGLAAWPFAILLPKLKFELKSIELPGGIKIEFSDIYRIEKQVEEIGIVSPIHEDVLPEERSTFDSLAKQDINLALAALRIELEKTLRALAEKNDLSTEHVGMGRLVDILRRERVLSDEEAPIIRDLSTILNRAVHGASVDMATGERAIDVGLDIINALKSRNV